MKYKYYILALVVLGIIAVSIWSAKNEKIIIEKTPDAAPVATGAAIPTSGKYCFARIQKATDIAPYSAEEHVVLNFSDMKVAGTKNGTQAGPDMTNGYEGTLSGSVIEDEMELTYAYTVEGSKNRELEVYTITNGKLIKKRWVLHEAKINNQSILVPDYKGEPTLITYNPESCTQ